MVTILTKLKVRDFDAWVGSFRKHAETRAQFGCRSETVFRPGSIPSSPDVFVIVDWSSEKAFQDYMGWLRPQRIPEDAGVLTAPEHVVLGERAA